MEVAQCFTRIQGTEGQCREQQVSGQCVAQDVRQKKTPSKIWMWRQLSHFYLRTFKEIDGGAAGHWPIHFVPWPSHFTSRT
jgi:hypothetical protein